MKVRIRTNLGSVDAESIKHKCGSELNHAECVCGAEVSVPAAAAALLIERGIAEAAEEPETTKEKEPPVLLKTPPVAEKPEKEVRGKAKKPDITGPAKQ